LPHDATKALRCGLDVGELGQRQRAHWATSLPSVA
jgi:hypothetical protein